MEMQRQPRLAYGSVHSPFLSSPKSSLPPLLFHQALKASTQVMDGRFFSGTKVEAHIADGNEKFKRSSEKKLGMEEGGGDGAAEDDEGKRLDKFGSWLEEEGGRKGAAA